MGKIYHVHLDIRSVIHMPDEMLQSLLLHPAEARSLTPREVRDHMLDELQRGRAVLPFGAPCEGFCYQTGCAGHEPVHTQVGES